MPSATPRGSRRKTNPAGKRRGGGTQAGAMLLTRFFTRSTLKPARKSIHRRMRSIAGITTAGSRSPAGGSIFYLRCPLVCFRAAWGNYEKAQYVP